MQNKNRFDEKYEIRLARYEEIPEIMSFIEEHWKKGHILARNRDFFEYEMVVDDSVNFLIAKQKEKGLIDGVLGFLPCSHDKKKLDIWGVIWKTTSEAMPMLGMEMKKRLKDITGARTELGVGANLETSIPLLKRIYHYYTAKMKHYYRLSNVRDFVIAKIENKQIPDVKTSADFQVYKLENLSMLKSFFDFDKIEAAIPYKDLWYYDRRFFQHPIYHYCVWGLENKEQKAVLITKTEKYNGSSVIRIVDYIGAQMLFGQCGVFFDTLLQDNEYIDFYFVGFDEKYVKQAGMLALLENDKNIIPDYFHPFEQKNVDIYVDSSNNKDKCLFFKADGDQDRPN